MTRKHYERLAAILAWQYGNAMQRMQRKGDVDSRIAEIVHLIAIDIAVMCKDDNVAFDTTKFLRAVTG